MSGQFNTSNYDTINEEIRAMLSTGKYSSVAINMYTNPECTDVALDTSGNPIVNKSVLNLSNTTAHTDLDGNHKNATATITFTDDSTLLADDETDLYWYILVGVPVQYTKF
jgi:hypothetical protein